MTRSSAGTTAPGPCGWLGLLAAEPVTPSIFRSAAALITTYDQRTQMVGAPLPRIAAIVGQHPDTVRGNLRQLAADRWLDVARASKGGRGQGTLLRLRQPDLLVAETPLAGGGLSAVTPLTEGGLDAATPTPGGGLDTETPLSAGGFTPPHPPGKGRDREGTPLPPHTPFVAVPDGPVRDVVLEVVAALPRRLQGHSNGVRERLYVVVADLLAAGWSPGELVSMAGYDLPADPIRTPARFVRARFDGLHPRQVPAGAGERPARCAEHPYADLPCRSCAADRKAAG